MTTEWSVPRGIVKRSGQGEMTACTARYAAAPETFRPHPAMLPGQGMGRDLRTPPDPPKIAVRDPEVRVVIRSSYLG
ncbi:hypothetical protein GCM10027203_44970 [Nonomuraea fastidiosa]